jgi:DNA-binding NarL/FixJ family response regulator
MSRAAIIVALARVLHRPPTAEEIDTARMTLLEFCPEGRLSLAPNTPSETERRAQILALWHAGKSIRGIARELKIHRRDVREVVGPNSAFNWPHPQEQGAA